MSGTVVRSMRERGHDVLSVKESLRGATDEEILARAQSEHRIVVTQDKDFGELAFRSHLPASCGIILFRLVGIDPLQDNRRMIEALDIPREWHGHFAVINETQIRMRPLPLLGTP